jgi:hypothetical protein
MINYKSNESYQKVLDAQKRGRNTSIKNALLKREIYNKNPIKCLACGKPIDFYYRNKNKFCSHGCAARYNNALMPHKKPLIDKFCKRCGNKIERTNYRSGKILCKECKENGISYNDNTLLSEIIYTQYHKATAFSLIRARARNIAKKAGMNTCVCGYNKHVEICHKKPISSFSGDTPLKKINSLDNLIALCPTCHWEFDNGLLNI